MPSPPSRVWVSITTTLSPSTMTSVWLGPSVSPRASSSSPTARATSSWRRGSREGGGIIWLTSTKPSAVPFSAMPMTVCRPLSERASTLNSRPSANCSNKVAAVRRSAGSASALSTRAMEVLPTPSTGLATARPWTANSRSTAAVSSPAAKAGFRCGASRSRMRRMASLSRVACTTAGSTPVTPSRRAASAAGSRPNSVSETTAVGRRGRSTSSVKVRKAGRSRKSAVSTRVPGSRAGAPGSCTWTSSPGRDAAALATVGLAPTITRVETSSVFPGQSSSGPSAFTASTFPPPFRADRSFGRRGEQDNRKRALRMSTGSRTVTIAPDRGPDLASARLHKGRFTSCTAGRRPASACARAPLGMSFRPSFRPLRHTPFTKPQHDVRIVGGFRTNAGPG